MGIVRKFIKVQQTVYRFFAQFAGGMVLLAAILACINALARKGIGSTIVWAEEACTYMCTMVIFLVYAYLETTNQQLCIDLLVTSIKNKKAKLVLYIVRGIVTAVITAILLRYGFAATATAFRLGTVTYVIHIPRWFLYSIVDAGYILVLLGWISVLFCNKGRPFEC